MTISEYREAIAPMKARAEQDGDALFVFYGSRSDDYFEGDLTGVDSGDALIIISRLIEKCGLSDEAIAEMMHAPALIDDTPTGEER